jgi:hypothetical protein
MVKITDAFTGAIRKAIDVATGHTHTPAAAPAAPDDAEIKRQMDVADRVMRDNRELLRELAKR